MSVVFRRKQRQRPQSDHCSCVFPYYGVSGGVTVSIYITAQHFHIYMFNCCCCATCRHKNMSFSAFTLTTFLCCASWQTYQRIFTWAAAEQNTTHTTLLSPFKANGTQMSWLEGTATETRFNSGTLCTTQNVVNSESQKTFFKLKWTVWETVRTLDVLRWWTVWAAGRPAPQTDSSTMSQHGSLMQSASLKHVDGTPLQL